MDFVLLVGHLVVVDDVHIAHDIHLLLSCSFSSCIVVIEILGQGIFHVVVEVKVTSVWAPYAVGRLVVHQHTEGLVLVTLILHPVDGQVGNDIGDISLTAYLLSVENEVGVVVVALACQNVPIVESCRV